MAQQQEQSLLFSDLLLHTEAGVSVFTAVAMCCFAFSTIIGWGLYGARCCEFLFSSSRTTKPFMVLYSLVAILGATVDLGLFMEYCRNLQRFDGYSKPYCCIPSVRCSCKTCKRVFYNRRWKRCLTFYIKIYFSFFHFVQNVPVYFLLHSIY